MLTIIEKYSDYAAIMQAVYGNPTNLGDKDADNFTPTQVEEFTKRFSLVSHEPDDNTGFSATLFRDSQNEGQAILGIRGTSELINDLLHADLDDIRRFGLALNQSISLYNYTNSLRTGTQRQIALTSVIASEPPEGLQVLYSDVYDAEAPVEYEYFYLEEIASIQGSGDIADGEQIIVSGHSLGGHLAAITSALFPELVAEVYTYNAPGFDGFTSEELTFSAIHQITGNTDFTGFDSTLIHSLVGESYLNGDDIDGVSAIGIPFSAQQGIFIESNLGLAGHSKVQMTDSLKLYDVFSKMDVGISSSEVNYLLHSGSNKATNSLESITEKLAQLFNIAEDDIPEFVDSSDLNARNKYHQVIKEINTKIKDKQYNLVTITSSVAVLAMQDTEAGKGYRYALVNLIPFAITSNLSGTAVDNEAYDLENFSEQYLADRANMLQWLIKYNYEGVDYGEYLAADGFDGNVTYTDLSSETNNGQDLVLKIDGDGVAIPYEQIKFGTEYDDGIAGADNDDRLYGGGGKDSILGKDGEDYIEGGKGYDTIYSHVDFTLSDNSYVETIRTVDTNSLQQTAKDHLDLTGNNIFYLLAMAA